MYDQTTWHLIELMRRLRFLERKTEQYGADVYKSREISSLIWALETLAEIPELAGAIAHAEEAIERQELRRKAG